MERSASLGPLDACERRLERRGRSAVASARVDAARAEHHLRQASAVAIAVAIAVASVTSEVYQASDSKVTSYYTLA